jgi:hypothetical protein
VVIVVSRRLAVVALSTVVVLALVAANLAFPAVSRATAIYSRVASCAGLSFYPTDSETKYSNNGALRIRTDNGAAGGSGAFRCDPGLPNHAVVTKIQFTVAMEQVTQTLVIGVRNCQLRRSSLGATTAGAVQTLGSVNIPGNPPGGPKRATTTSISFATVDNAQFGYWLECLMDTDAGATTVGIYGADVTYSIAAPYA